MENSSQIYTSGTTTNKGVHRRSIFNQKCEDMHSLVYSLQILSKEHISKLESVTLLKGDISYYQSITSLFIFGFALLLILLVIQNQLTHTRHNDRHENAGALFHSNRVNAQTKLWTGKTAQLVIIIQVNKTGCFTQECLLASNSTIRILGNNPNPPTFAGSTAVARVALDPGHYTVVQPIKSIFYKHLFSSECSGLISAGQTKTCIITNSYANGIQTWLDKWNDIRIQFSHSPPFPFVGNIIELNFQVTTLNTSKPLELTHTHITLTKNDNSRNNFITFDNITARHGVFSTKYQFLKEGIHQIIVKVRMKNGEAALASFNIPVARFWWNLF